LATVPQRWSRDSRTAPVPARAGVSLGWVVRSLLCASFTVSFLQYAVHTGVGQFLHLGLLFLAGLAVLSGPHRAERVQNLLGGGSVLLLAMCFSEAISYVSGDTYSIVYGLVFIGVILASRLVVQEIGVPNVVRAFSQAGIIVVVIMAATGGKSLRTGTVSQRFNGGIEVHPNLLSFVLGGYLPVLIWRALEYKILWRRRVVGLLALLDLVFIYYSGSRGTVGAALISGLIFAGRRTLTGPWVSRLRLQRWHLIAALLLVPLVLAYLNQHNRIGNIVDAVTEHLALNNSERGLSSGLSGRTSFWRAAFQLLGKHDRWLFGFGYRAGDRLVGTIDNGYIQLLFESGLIAGLLIFGSMLRVWLLLWRSSRPVANTAWIRYYTMLNCTMVIYFFNNISTRYLFSFGSSFSILMILLMTASRQQLVGAAALRPRIASARRPVPRTGMAWSAPARDSAAPGI
jgi:hypothetical protein